MPDDVSKKSLKVLDKKLQMLAEHADFHVNINSRVRRRHPQSGGRAGRRQACAGTRLHLDRRHHPRWRRTTQPLGEREREVFLEMQKLEKQQLLAVQLVSRKTSRNGRAQRLALPRRRTLSLHLRGRPGALLLAAARLSRQAARTVHASRTSAASTTPKRAALRSAPYPAFTRSRTSTPGAIRKQFTLRSNHPPLKATLVHLSLLIVAFATHYTVFILSRVSGNVLE